MTLKIFLSKLCEISELNSMRITLHFETDKTKTIKIKDYLSVTIPQTDFIDTKMTKLDVFEPHFNDTVQKMELGADTIDIWVK